VFINRFLGPRRRGETFHLRNQLLRSRLAGLDLADEIVELHAIRARRPPDEVESGVRVEAVPLGENALGLFDCDPRLKGVLELRPPLVGGLGDGQQSPDGDSGLVGAAHPQRLDGLELGPVVHGGQSYLRRSAIGRRGATVEVTEGDPLLQEFPAAELFGPARKEAS